MRHEVSIIIVSWNVWEMVRDCIVSIQQQTSISYEIIVIDNDSHDGTAANVGKQFPEVILIKNSENYGFAAANNQGLEVATGENVLILNPDTIIQENAIDVMVGWLKKKSDVGCVGCRVFESEKIVQKTCFSDPSPLSIFLIETGLHRFKPARRYLGWPEYYSWDRNDEREVDVVSGMFMLIPKKVIEKVGPMDDAFFVYSEEADLCRRIRQHGYKCIFSPLASILHRDGGSKSTYQIRPKMFVQLQRSKLIYTYKHYGFIGYLAVKSIYILSMSARLFLYSLLFFVKGKSQHKLNMNLARVSLMFHLFSVDRSVQ